ncbi:MAG: hypothetical protein M1835_000451, partial [Candelina submexicana]
EPDSKTDTVSEPCGVTRAQETDGANIAEMQETLLGSCKHGSKGRKEQETLEEAEDTETSGDTGFLDKIGEEQAAVIPEGSDGSLLAMTLTIRNKVNGKYVLRPLDLQADDKWSLEYSIDEVPTASRAWSLYGACQARRKSRMDSANDDSEDDVATNYYLRRMRELSEKGREWRKVQDSIDAKNEKVVLGQSTANDERCV